MSTPFASIIREHKKTVQKRRQELDGQKADAASAIEACTTATLTNITQANITIANAQRTMEQEAANMAVMADNFHRRAAAWSGSYLALNEAIKQLGDVAQWTQVVEADMKFIAMALDNATNTHNKTYGSRDGATTTATTATPTTTPSSPTITTAAAAVSAKTTVGESDASTSANTAGKSDTDGDRNPENSESTPENDAS